MSADHAAKLGITIDKLSPHHGHTHRDEYNFRHRKGHPLIFDVALTAIKPIAGNRATVMAIVENRTEEREREDQVLQQQKLESIGNLAGGIAHDFNNLFVAIMANAELLGQNVRRGPEDAAICSDIVAATQRAAKLCEQLLAYAGKAPMAEQPLNLSTLIRDSRSLLKMAVSRNATLQFTCDEGLPAILADPSQIRQLILNLLTNASEALAGESGELNVATSEVNLGKVDVVAFSDTLPPPKPGNYVCVSVSDTGTGVTSSTIGKLFEPFYTTKGMATGLGLAAVQGIVRAHRGVLAVESSPDDGTTVRVLFPVATKGMQSAPSVPRNALTPLPTPPTGGTVLLVDDEELVADAARRILELSGYAVITASNGLEGVDVFRERYKNLTVVLLDLTMPVMDGVEASAEMHAICPDVPIILSSGFSEAEAQKSGVKAIAAGYLRKPYRVRELLDTIENVLTP
jgi:two-component system, cell cycle sensor histidine kinase and response regulator CckA